MNLHRQNIFLIPVRGRGAALALFIFLGAGRAQEAGGSRWLLIFDTSAAMKKRLPATDTAVNQFFSMSGNDQLQAGDSVGVWTFDQQLNGQFPTFTWSPDQAAMTSSNLLAFIHRQRYHLDSQLGIVRNPVNHIVANSQRLTVVIFCDGQSQISGTPYDAGINQTFTDMLAERKKNEQPFVVVLRSQSGKYIGCTLNLPPGNLNFPPFPELPPPPPPPVVAPPRPVVVAPPPVVPDLVIVGTHVSTDPNEPPPVKSPATNVSISALTNVVIPPTNPVAVPPPAMLVAKPVIVTTNPPLEKPDVVPPPVVSPPPPVKTVIAPAAPSATNPVAATVPDAPDRPARILVFVGVGLLVSAIVLVVILLAFSRRRPHASLITSSMHDEPPRK